MPRVSAVVGAFNRPGRLRTFLACLVDQTFTDWEAVVVDNSDQPEALAASREMCKIDPRIRYEEMGDRAFSPLHGIRSLYDASEIGIAMTTGEWIWVPNDDTYACPWFLQRMMETVDATQAEFVFCDFVQGRPDVPHHGFVTTAEACQIDKTCYIIRRDKFPIPWPGKIEQYGVADGILVNELVAKGIKLAKLQQMLIVHN